MATELGQLRPAIWSPKLIVDLDEVLVGANLVNRDYEGEITGKGNIVKINEIGDVTVSDYTENTDMTVRGLTAAQLELVIDQAKSFNFNVDDVLRAQANVEFMSAAMRKAAKALAKAVDTRIASMYSEAGVVTSGLGSASSALTLYGTHTTAASSLLGMLANMTRYADEADMPDDRWFWMPPWMHSYFIFAQLVDNPKGSGGIKGGPTTRTGNGYVGSLSGWDLYASNNVATTSTTYHCMFGTKDAISFAGQVTKMESTRREKQFGELVKGLYVYGSKVVRPDHLGCVHAAAGGLST